MGLMKDRIDPGGETGGLPIDGEPDDAPEMICGLNAVLGALKKRAGNCRSIWIAEGRHSNPTLAEIRSLAKGAGLMIKVCPRSTLDRLCGRDKHQGVAALFDARSYASFEDLLARVPEKGPCLIVALDRVEDPGNLGALMRSAVCFGAAGVLVPRERSAPLTPAALKAAAGAADVLPLARTVNLRRALGMLKDRGFWVLGAEGEGGDSLFNFSFPERSVLVLGSEGKGLGPMIKKAATSFWPSLRRAAWFHP